MSFDSKHELHGANISKRIRKIEWWSVDLLQYIALTDDS